MLIIVIIAVVVGGVVALAATQPDRFQVQRSATIQAKPEALYALVEDFHRWTAWSPWEKLDPDMQRTYSGAASGKGAIYGWEGKKAGAGRMEIADTTPSRRIVINLDFTRPMKASNLTEFSFEPQGSGTAVTWTMSGKSPFMAKALHMVFNMDKLVGKDFETGLANMKAATEG